MVSHEEKILKVIRTAREWIGTPFHIHGRKKGVACDCLGLIMGVAKKLKLKTLKGTEIAHLDTLSYSIGYSHNGLAGILDSLMQPVQDNAIPPGHLALMGFDHNFNHLAIISHLGRNVPSIIHSSYPCRKVVEQRLDKELSSKIKKIYRLVN